MNSRQHIAHRPGHGLLELASASGDPHVHCTFGPRIGFGIGLTSTLSMFPRPRPLARHQPMHHTRIGAVAGGSEADDHADAGGLVGSHSDADFEEVVDDDDDDDFDPRPHRAEYHCGINFGSNTEFHRELKWAYAHYLRLTEIYGIDVQASPRLVELHDRIEDLAIVNRELTKDEQVELVFLTHWRNQLMTKLWVRHTQSLAAGLVQDEWAPQHKLWRAELPPLKYESVNLNFDYDMLRKRAVLYKLLGAALHRNKNLARSLTPELYDEVVPLVQPLFDTLGQLEHNGFQTTPQVAQAAKLIRKINAIITPFAKKAKAQDNRERQERELEREREQEREQQTKSQQSPTKHTDSS